MFDVGRLSTKPNHLADLAELLLAFTDREHFSSTDMHSIIVSKTSVADELPSSEVEDIDDDEFDDSLSSAEISDAQQAQIDEAFEHLSARAKFFGDAYPFEIARGVLELKSAINNIHITYFVLLACSRTRSFKAIKGLPNRLADHFEDISAAALQQLMGSHAQIFQFGPNSQHRKEIFGSKLRDALPILAKICGMELQANWEASIKSDSGDAKIDLVGVRRTTDEIGPFFVVVGQCATSEEEKEWQKKRLEADFDYQRGVFNFFVRPIPALFIPHCYRTTSGEWFTPNNVSGVYPIDRKRIMELFIESDSSRNYSKKIYDELVATAA